jgi:hypothetical protein
MKNRLIRAPYLLALLSISACTSAENDATLELGEAALQGIDLTPTLPGNVADLRGKEGDEGVRSVYDDNPNTKLLVSRPTEWIQYRMTQPAVVTSYDITSANDEPSRDPKNWTFEGSLDGTNWKVLDSRVDEAFASRLLKKSYTFANTTPYLYYRLNIAEPWVVDDALQLAEFRIGGALVAGTLPTVPTLAAPVVNGNSVRLSWNAVPGATGYVVERFADDGQSTIEMTTSATTYTDTGLSPATAYVYKVQAVNGNLRGYPSEFVRARTPGVPTGLQDITALTSTAPTEQWPGNGIPSESIENVTDNNPYTDYYEPKGKTWLQIKTPSAVVTQYTLTSAYDDSSMDPSSWKLQGSSDGASWVTLDTRSNQAFIDRFQKRVFTCNPSKVAYTYYRLVILTTKSATDSQLAEWRLLGTTSATLKAPQAPSSPVAAVLSNSQIRLTWRDNARQINPERAFRIERATDSAFTQNVVTKWAGANSTEFRATGLSPSQTYFFRVTAVNDAGNSTTVGPVSATTTNTEPPTSFVENRWYGGHNRTVYKTYSDANVAIYFDQYVPNASSITWFNSAMSEAYAYVKRTYGDLFDPTLYVIANMDGVSGATNYGGGGVIDAFSNEAWYRNTVFVVNDDWKTPDWYGWSFPALTHELGHVVESVNNGVGGSPSYGDKVWQDSKWAEIFQYDLYAHLGSVPPDLAQRTYTEQLDYVDVLYGRHWFRDWYAPIYNGTLGNTATDKKGTAFLVKYFQLVSQYFPQINSGYDPRSLNMGEFVHFCSAAAGVDLLAQAKRAFTWTPELELQFAKAQTDFPALGAMYGVTLP